MIQLLARKEQIKSPGTKRCTSVAAALRIVRQVMRYVSEVPRRTERFTARLSCAVIDAYQRKRPKESRDYPRRKEQPDIGPPKLAVATKQERKLLQYHLQANAA